MKGKLKVWHLCLIVGLFVVLVGSLVLWNLFGKDDNEEDAMLEQRVEELFANSYKVFWTIYGDVNIGDGFIIVDEVKYYKVDDASVLVPSAANELLKDTFISSKVGMYLNNIDSLHDYLESEEKVYVDKSEEYCKNASVVNLDELTIKKIDDETAEVNWRTGGVEVVLENGKWVLVSSPYVCLDRKY